MNTERTNEINQLNSNISKHESYVQTLFVCAYVFAGVLIGSAIMYFSHADIYNHYNNCQEAELKEAVAKLADGNCYKVVTDSITGKISIK